MPTIYGIIYEILPSMEDTEENMIVFNPVYRNQNWR